MEKEDLKGNLENITSEKFVFSEDETKYLNSWTNLSMQILEAEHSLKFALKFNEVEPFDKFEDFVLAHGMFKNSILSYAKCFSSSGKGKVSLDANDVFKMDVELRKIHDALMDMRNGYIAHNGNSDFELAIVLQKKVDNEMTLSQTITFKTPVGDYEKFFQLFDHCTNYIVEKVNHKVDKLESKFGLKIKFN